MKFRTRERATSPAPVTLAHRVVSPHRLAMRFGRLAGFAVGGYPRQDPLPIFCRTLDADEAGHGHWRLFLKCSFLVHERPPVPPSFSGARSYHRRARASVAFPTSKRSSCSIRESPDRFSRTATFMARSGAAGRLGLMLARARAPSPPPPRPGAPPGRMALRGSHRRRAWPPPAGDRRRRRLHVRKSRGSSRRDGAPSGR